MKYLIYIMLVLVALAAFGCSSEVIEEKTVEEEPVKVADVPSEDVDIELLDETDDVELGELV